MLTIGENGHGMKQSVLLKLEERSIIGSGLIIATSKGG
jgi:hypothetical protein